MGAHVLFQIAVNKACRQQGEEIMDVFRDNVITEIERNHIKKIQIHGIIGPGEFGKLINSPMLYIEFWDEEMMGECVTAGWGDRAKQNRADYQCQQEDKQDAVGHPERRIGFSRNHSKSFSKTSCGIVP